MNQMTPSFNHASAFHKTFQNAQWIVPSAQDHALIQHFLKGADLPLFLGEILMNRGIASENIDAFLHPTLKMLLPNPSHFMDMDRAVTETAAAIMAGEKIGVFGDYDVDGATSTALLLRYFKAIRHPSDFHIPDRLAEGYGVSEAGLDALLAQNCKRVITVDCGTSSNEAITYGNDQGQRIIVLDHHKSGPQRPPCVALVNPNQDGEQSPLTYLCAAGMVFIFLVGLNRDLRQKGFFKDKPEPDLMTFLDLVALGTVCDVVPLVGLNRAYVRQGLIVMEQKKCVGLAALAEIGGISGPIKPYHLGFVLGPRINAGGRISGATLGVQLLTASCPEKAREIARRLDEANRERQIIESDAVAEAQGQVQAILEKGETLPPVLLCLGENWHPGIVGLVASRIKEQYHRPTVALTLYDTIDPSLDPAQNQAPVIAKGSARSIPGFDMGDAIIAGVNAGIVLKGGGHPMAGGLSIAEDKIPALHAFLNEKATAVSTDRIYHIACRLPVRAITPTFITMLDRLQPFGMGNPTPKFLFSDVILSSFREFGTGHVKAWIQDYGGKGIELLAFRGKGTGALDFMKQHQGQCIHVVGTVSKSSWQGRDTLQIMLEDMALSVEQPQDQE